MNRILRSALKSPISKMARDAPVGIPAANVPVQTWYEHKRKVVASLMADQHVRVWLVAYLRFKP